jgi:hypothetical protein
MGIAGYIEFALLLHIASRNVHWCATVTQFPSFVAHLPPFYVTARVSGQFNYFFSSLCQNYAFSGDLEYFC